MSSSYRRYEILLPRRFNDGQAVPDELIAETLLELRERSARSRPKPKSFAVTGKRKDRYTLMTWSACSWMRRM